jgi:hypothetical protein
MLNDLPELLTAINSLESISSAWGTLRSRDYWGLWSTPELDEQVAAEIRGLRIELADLQEKRDALLAADGLVWRDGAIVDAACDQFIDEVDGFGFMGGDVLDDDWIAHRLSDRS